MNFICASFLLLISYKAKLPITSNETDTLPQCSCSYSYKPIYPNSAAEKHISGNVIIGITVDSLHYLSNPTIIKSLEDDCDKEALRICNLIIHQLNDCQKRCGANNNLSPGITKQIISFNSDE